MKEHVPDEPEPKKGRTFPVDLEPKRIEDSLGKLKAQVVTLAKRGRYTKVRFKFRGKQVLPDIPLAAVVAVEGATFYWTGLLRALIFNLAGRTVLDVELVNESAKIVDQAKQALLSGDSDKALSLLREAEAMDRTSALVHLTLGVVHMLRGDKDLARSALGRAVELDEGGALSKEAEQLLGKLPPSAD